MQYLLTEQEYDALQREKRLRTEQQDKALLEVCVMAAIHAPGRNGAKESWGCILSPLPQTRAPYCDDCPAHAACPHPGKEYSQ